MNQVKWESNCFSLKTWNTGSHEDHNRETQSHKFSIMSYIFYNCFKCDGVMVKSLAGGVVVREFELQSRY